MERAFKRGSHEGRQHQLRGFCFGVDKYDYSRAGLALEKPGDIAVSLGTSDTVSERLRFALLKILRARHL